MATKADKAKKRKDRKELRTAEREAKLKAFKSIDSIVEMIAFIITYGKSIVAIILGFSIGFVVGKYDLILLILKKAGVV